MVDFGNTLKALRIQNNLTQAQLADMLGVKLETPGVSFMSEVIK